MRGEGVLTRRTSLSLGMSLALLTHATMASAQGLPPPPNAPGAQPPPPMAAPLPQAPPPPDAQQAPPQVRTQPGGPIPPSQPLVLLGPSRLPYDAAEPVPPGYEIQTRPAMGLAKAGIATFVPLYGLSALFGGVYLGSENGDAKRYGPMAIPVIGPFVTIGTADTSGGTLFLLFDGLGQVTGATLFLIGMLSEEKYLARTSAGLNLRPEVFIGPKSAALRWQF